MKLGQEFPLYQMYQEFYPKSQTLKVLVCELLTLVIKLCHKGIKTSKSLKPTLSTFDTLFGEDERALEAKCKEIQNIAELEKQQRLMEVQQEIKQLRQELTHPPNRQRPDLRVKYMRAYTCRSIHAFLDACSDYDAVGWLRFFQQKGNSNWLQRRPCYAAWRDIPGSQILWTSGKLGSGAYIERSRGSSYSGSNFAKLVSLATQLFDILTSRLQAERVLMFCPNREVCDSRSSD